MDREQDRLTCENCPFGRRCTDPPTARFEFLDVDEQTPIPLASCPRYYVMQHPLVLGDPFNWLQRISHGILPQRGGWLEQPHLFVETMELLGYLHTQMRRRQRLLHERATENSSAKTDRNF